METTIDNILICLGDTYFQLYQAKKQIAKAEQERLDAFKRAQKKEEDGCKGKKRAA